MKLPKITLLGSKETLHPGGPAPESVLHCTLLLPFP